MRRALVAAAIGAALAGCGIGASRTDVVTFPPTTFGPGASVTAAGEAARAAVGSALSGAGFQVGNPQVPFRPPESPALAAAPRVVVQVLLPNDPDHGYVSIYELPDPEAAVAAGREQAAYVASGPGRVQFPPDSRFVVRRVGSAVVFYAWSPANAPNPDTAGIQAALETVGDAVEVPR